MTIKYETSEIAEYFSKNRISFAELYDSEKAIFSGLDINKETTLLDGGCACGGLGLALNNEFGLLDYTGIDLNQLAIQMASSVYPDGRYICGDVKATCEHILKDIEYDIVCSLSCIDWNDGFYETLPILWTKVKPGGSLVLTLRLTNFPTLNSLTHAYQYINYGGLLSGEIAHYTVLNYNDALQQIMKLQPSRVRLVGYWGKPSATAVIPYSRLCFTALSIQKATNIIEDNICALTLDIPSSLFTPAIATRR